MKTLTGVVLRVTTYKLRETESVGIYALLTSSGIYALLISKVSLQ